MSEPQQAGKKNNWLGVVIGLAVSLVALGILIYLVDFKEVLKAIRLADFKYLPLVFVFFFATLATRAMAWRTLLQEKISFGKSFLTINEGYLFNNVLPFRLGEVARAFLLSQTTPITFWEGMSTVVVERVFDVALLATLLLSTVPFVIGAEWAMQSAVVAAVLVVAGFVTLFLVARYQPATVRLFERLTSPWPKLTEWGGDKLRSVLDGLQALREPLRFLKVLFWITVTWCTNIAWYTFLLWAFVPDATVLMSAFAVGVVSLGVSAPSSPGFVGVFEAAQVVALSIFGIEESVIFAYAVISHSFYLILTITIGAIALGRDGQSLGQVYRGIRNCK